MARTTETTPGAPAARTALRSCGCPEGDPVGSDILGRYGFSRRAFLKRSAVVAAATALTGRELATQLAFASSPTYAGDVLIVLSLRGGFDGLSVVVPANDPDFHALRPNIRVPESQLLTLGTAGNGNDNRFGLHPAMAPLMPMWAAGTFGLVHAVGQVNPTRSHFEATQELEKAAPGSDLRTGWLDRMLGARGTSTAFQACEVGYSEVSGDYAGPAPVLGIGSIDGFGLSGSDGTDLPQWDAALRGLNSGAPMSVQAPVATTLGALATVKTLGTVDTYVPENGAVYDENSDLSKALRDIARMIKAGVGLQAAALDYSNWDMHSGLADKSLDPTTGWMHDQVTELATALATFYQDLGPTRTAKTSLVTLSEFGRRCEENGSFGLDHGHGNAVLLLGGGIVGGKVHGTWLGLSDPVLDDGDVPATTDYRNLLGELLIKRCGASTVSDVFPGLSYTPLGIAH
jgi:uncharacterized protein (DUF1501 family)